MRALLFVAATTLVAGLTLAAAAHAEAPLAAQPTAPAAPPAPFMPPPLSALPLVPPAPTTSPAPSHLGLLKGPIEPLQIKIPEASAPSPPKAEPDADYTTKRYEPAGFPLLGGDSDIGFQFGAVATLSHFADGIRPYSWNMDLVVSASVKNGPKGVQLVQQSYLYNADLPGYLDGKLRLNPQVQYQRTINMGYFGLGDAASHAIPANFTGPTGRYFQWIDSVANGILQPRYTIAGPWQLTGAVGYRYMDPTAYADSKLARDAQAKNPDGTPVVRGLTPLSITQLAIGGIYDTRDDEIFPRKGAFGQVGVAYQQGIPTGAGVVYGEAEGLLQVYRSIGGPFVLAARGVADFQFGHEPFYDLFEAGPFGQFDAIGGAFGVRGVPVGRYSGEIKVFGNVELRAMFIHFHLFKQKVSLGADVLFDTGRSWLDYSFASPLDGKGIGLKYGLGGGLYCLYGQAAFFRVDAAYSPSAAAENPSFPVGIYVADGVMF